MNLEYLRQKEKKTKSRKDKRQKEEKPKSKKTERQRRYRNGRQIGKQTEIQKDKKTI